MSLSFEPMYAGTTVVSRSGKRFSLEKAGYLGLGDQGEVFRVTDEYAVKLYFDKPISSSLQEKLATLCALGGRLHECVVAPIDMVRLAHQPSNEAAGFLMKYLPDARPIDKFKWNVSTRGEDEPVVDQQVANFVYDISDALANLHGNYVCMGDLKPANILISGQRPYLIDFDSCSLPGYPADCTTIQFVDPRLRGMDANAKGPYQFEARSDWWALAVIAFELFMGVSPWSGDHPKLKRQPVRSYNYCAVLFDKDVEPFKYTRPATWLAARPKIRAYFKGIFSPDKAKRVPMVDLLQDSFPKQELPQTSRIASVLSGLATSNASINDKIKQLEQELEKEYALPLSPEQMRFVRPLVNKISEMAIKNAITREEARIGFLNAMFNL